MVRICNAQIGHSGYILIQVRVLYHLNNAGEGASKIHVLWIDRSVYNVIGTVCPLVRLLRHSDYEAHPAVLLVYFYNVLQLDIIPKNLG